MISKELLSEVLEIEIVDYAINKNQVRINQLWHEDNPLNRELELFNTAYGCKVSTNIYELAYKCKEWAYENDYYIYSIVTFAAEGSCYLTHENNISKRLKTFDADTEQEAIFKACQWIFDNKGK